MMVLIIKSIVFVMASYVMLNSIRTITSMTTKTNHLVRIVFIILATIGFYETAVIIHGYIPNLYESIFTIGIGLSMLLDGRNDFNGHHYQDILR